MATKPRRLCTNDTIALNEVDLLLGDIERTLEPIANRHPMLWDEATERALNVLVRSARARQKLTEVLLRPRSDKAEEIP
jgi:hypothetical protein